MGLEITKEPHRGCCPAIFDQSRAAAPRKPSANESTGRTWTIRLSGTLDLYGFQNDQTGLLKVIVPLPPKNASEMSNSIFRNITFASKCPVAPGKTNPHLLPHSRNGMNPLLQADCRLRNIEVETTCLSQYIRRIFSAAKDSSLSLRMTGLMPIALCVRLVLHSHDSSLCSE